MADKDKLRFLTGQEANLKDKTLVRGQVYFAISSDTDSGKIYFDAPIDENTTKRILMSSDHAKTADKATAADRATADSNGRKFTETYVSEIKLDNAGTTILYKYPDITTWKELKPKFLPLTGGTITGELYADSITAGDLLVNGSARFVNTILGNIETANQWKTARGFQIADADAAHTSVSVNVNGSGNVVLKLPSTIKAALQGNADTATKATNDSNNKKITDEYLHRVSNTSSTLNQFSGAPKYLLGIESFTDGGEVKWQSVDSVKVGSASGADKWNTAVNFQVSDSDAAYTGTAVSVNGSKAIVLPLPATIKATLEGNASSANKVNHKYTLTLGTTKQTAFDGSADVSITITPKSIGALGKDENAVSSAKWSTARTFYIADADASNTGTGVSVDGSKDITLKLPSTIKGNLKGSADMVDSLHAARGAGLYYTAKEVTFTSTDTVYIKITTDTNYYSDILKFYIEADYDNINGAVLATNFCRRPNQWHLVSSAYNGSNVVGVYQYNEDTLTYYVALRGYRGVYANSTGRCKIYSNTNIQSLEVITSSHSDYETIKTYNFIAPSIGGISATNIWGSLLPYSDNNYTLGNSVYKWKAIYATTLEGNAKSADKWSTARNMRIVDNGATNSGDWVSVDGSAANYTLQLPATIKASITGHASNDLPLTGGTLTGALIGTTFTAKTPFTLSSGKVTGLTSGTTGLYSNGIAISNPTTANDVGWVRMIGSDENTSILEIATGDDGSQGDGAPTREEIYVRQYTTDNTIAREIRLFDKSGNSSFPGVVTAVKFIGPLQGTADRATSDIRGNAIINTYLTNVYAKSDDSSYLYKQVGPASERSAELIGRYTPLDSDGLINMKYIPAAALERVVVVANQTAQYALTTANVQLGDVVKRNDTGQLYFVVDTNNLGNAGGYLQFTAGTAANINWSGILNRPNIVGSATGNAIVPNTANTEFTVYQVNGNGTSTSYVIKPNFLPKTGGTITGELYVDGGTTLASLLVNGDARFVNTIQGSISGNAGSANKWATAKAFYIADAEAKHTSSPSVNIDGSQSSYTLKLPSTIKATLEGNASSATNADKLDGLHASDFKTRIIKEKTLDTAGWYRILNITKYSSTFLITFYGAYNYQPPTPVTFLVSHSYDTTKITQIGGCAYIGWITKIRAVHYDTFKFYIDIYFARTQGNNYVNFEVMPLDPYSRTNLAVVDFTLITDSITPNAECVTRVNSYSDLSGQWETARNFRVADSDATNSGAWVAVDGSAENYTLKLPATIKATLTGNASTASKLTNLTSADQASSTATWRRVWFAEDDNVNGRPAYSDTFTYQSSTGTVKATKFQGALVGNATSADKWSTARSFITNLGSESPASVDGSTGPYNLGVTGVLPILHGGTGVTSIAEIKAGKDSDGNTIKDTYLKRYRNSNTYGSGYTDLNGTMPPFLQAYKNGYPLHTDPEFASGNNGIILYDNAGSGKTSLERIDMACGNSTGKVLRIRNTGAGPSPNLGGWYFGDVTAYARQYVCIFRAKAPTGYTINWHSNSCGTNSTTYWVTNRSGTGKWEWYAYFVDNGSANFASTMFFALEGTPGTADKPVDWFLSYANTIILSYGAYDGLRTRYADNADRWTNSRTFVTALNSESPASVNGTTNVTMGVYGTLPVSHGGTGQTSIANIQAGKDADGNTITSKYVSIYNSNNIGSSGSVTVNDLAKQGSAVGMINAATDNPFGKAGWVHVWSQAWNKTVNTSWVSQIALGVDESDGMWYRTKEGTIVGASWTRVIDSNNYNNYAVKKASSSTDNAIVRWDGTDGRKIQNSLLSISDEGLLTLQTGNHIGAKLGSAYITSANSSNGEIVLQNGHLRFGSDDWDYNQWAGLKYVHSSKIIYLGLADGTIFTANSAQSGGTLALPGIRYFSINGKIVIDANDGWLRINEGKAFTTGVYFGSNVVRTDGQLQVGDGGSKFYANSSGNGYFSNTLGIGGTNTSYKLYVNGASYINGNTTVNGWLKVQNTTDSKNSQDSNASLSVQGGVSVAKQLSAKTIRIDGSSSDTTGSTTQGCTVHFNKTNNCIEFVFD